MRALIAITLSLLACVFGPAAAAQGDLEVDVELVLGMFPAR
jgi:hypothetical protein